eukprot:XP_001708254.1 Hypothetical protein GL50803_28552 [Giardia lamblia ATCC 50803]
MQDEVSQSLTDCLSSTHNTLAGLPRNSEESEHLPSSLWLPD